MMSLEQSNPIPRDFAMRPYFFKSTHAITSTSPSHKDYSIIISAHLCDLWCVFLFTLEIRKRKTETVPTICPPWSKSGGS